MAVFAATAVNVSGTSSRRFNTEVSLNLLAWDVENFKAFYGRYPHESEGLDVLVERPPVWNDNQWFAFSSKHRIKDGWGNRFVYRNPGRHRTNAFDLYSFGRDGTSNTEGNDPDDINIWDESQTWRANYLIAENRPALILYSVVGGLLLLIAGIVYSVRARTRQRHAGPAHSSANIA